MLQYTVEPVSYLKILTIKTFCLENVHLITEQPLSIALELEKLSYQSVVPDDKLKMLEALDSRLRLLKSLLEPYGKSKLSIGNYHLTVTLVDELIELSTHEINRLANR